MTKFKIKNRQKRRYVRKQPFIYKTKPQPVVSHSSSKITIGNNWISLFSLIFASSMLMIILTMRPLSITLPEISLPTMSLPDFSHALDFVPPFSLPMITLPSLTVPQIALPQISLVPMQLLLLSLFQKVFTFTITLSVLSLAFLQFLNPGPMLIQLSKQVLSIENIVSQTNFMTIMFLSKTFLAIELGLLRYESAFFTQEFINFVSVENMIIHGFLVSISWIQTLLLTITNAFIVAGNKTGESIARPFKLMGEYYLAIKPYLLFLNDHVQQTFQIMEKGFTDLNTVTNELVKASQHK